VLAIKAWSWSPDSFYSMPIATVMNGRNSHPPAEVFYLGNRFGDHGLGGMNLDEFRPYMLRTWMFQGLEMEVETKNYFQIDHRSSGLLMIFKLWIGENLLDRRG
jgi:hypothetical protein